jgi:hypothetical protein
MRDTFKAGPEQRREPAWAYAVSPAPALGTEPGLPRGVSWGLFGHGIFGY